MKKQVLVLALVILSTIQCYSQLTNIEQIKIIRGDVAPTEVVFQELIEQVAISYFKDLIPTLKEVDGNINPNAESYVSKIKLGGSQIIHRSDIVSLSLAKVLISIYNGSYSAVENATDSQWEAFIVANIETAVNLVFGVLTYEKADYDNI